MVFDWSFSDSKSLHVSRIFLGIMTDFNNAVVRMVSYLLISKPSCPFSNSCGDCSKYTIYNWYHRHLCIQSITLVSQQGLHMYLSFCFPFTFTLPGQQCSLQDGLPLFSFFFFFLDSYSVWLSSRDYMICLHLKIPEEFVSLIFPDGFLLVWSNLIFFCTIPTGLRSPLSRALSYSLFVLTYCIRLL